MKTTTTSTKPTQFDAVKFEAFVRSVRELLGRGHLGEKNLRAMCSDPNWFMCWSDGMTSEQAVVAFRLAMN